MKEKFNSDGCITALLIAVGVGSFLLGGLFVHSLHAPAKRMVPIQLTPITAEVSVNDRRVYASQRGSRYYPWWCGAGSTLAKKNIIWYDSPEEAKAAGYTIAKGCQ